MAIDRYSTKGALVAAAKRAFGVAHKSAYRLSGGRLGGRVKNVPVLLLTARGRKTGKPRTVPLVYFEQDGAFVVASSNAGHWEPAWFRNVQRDPAVRVEVGRRRFSALARVASAEESAALWAKMEQLNPSFANYPRSRGVAIPMVVLEPQG